MTTDSPALVDDPTGAVDQPPAAPDRPVAKARRRVGWLGRQSRRGRRGRSLAGFLFLLPALISFGWFAWYPIGRNILLSFQQTNLVEPATWVGWENFQILFEDPLVWVAVKNTLYFTLLALFIGFPIPLLLAGWISELRRTGGLYRVLVYLPVAMPPVVAVLLWKFFYDPDFGLFNAVLGLVGLGPYPWYQSGESAMVSLVLVATWSNAGTTVLIYLAALTQVPTELYEAAEIDGASIPRRVWHVTLPKLRGVMLLMLLLQIIGTFQVFTEPYVITDGGPADSTVTVLLLIYRYGFQYGNYGVAAALSLMLAVVMAIVSALYFRLTRRWSPA